MSRGITLLPIANAPNIGRCNLKDPNLNECVGKNIEDAVRKFKDGAPQIGIPPFEPLKISKMVIGEGTGPVNVQQNFENIELFGLTDSKVLKEIVDVEQDKHYCESFSPKLELIGDYDMNGRVLVLPIRGKGRFNIILYNSSLTHNLTMEKYTKKDKTYLKMVNYLVTITPEKMHYQFDNLFDGDERLGSQINKVLNENWDSVYNDVRQGYENSFGLIFKGLADSLFSRVPYNEIFIVE
ncbi:hypothetical protein MML48_9g00001492 [Holotrichia oblita]|uniref:Uncharacterized protein n=1 Tax=Holotrichia oblita TaxID=644536 RepID=A0ACB9SHH2_HOLOL|nr:hypothetical protein MML48_9g00001492 [Holotrichia oblita]